MAATVDWFLDRSPSLHVRTTPRSGYSAPLMNAAPEASIATISILVSSHGRHNSREARNNATSVELLRVTTRLGQRLTDGLPPVRVADQVLHDGAADFRQQRLRFRLASIPFTYEEGTESPARTTGQRPMRGAFR
ncbi:hypothetical protein AXA44_33680 [Rhodococcus sp. SC4]|nr:hypothetical protein AXA44_33680 [Rhodococcus sp. SC4]